MIVIALVGALVAAVFLWRTSSQPQGDPRTASAEEEQERSAAIAHASEAPKAGHVAQGTDGSSAEPTLPVLDRKKRDDLRAAIWRSLGQDIPDAAPAPAAYVLPEVPPWPDDPGDHENALGRLDPQYIQDRVRNEFFPLARKCYGDMSERIADAGGRVVLAFDIVGNKNIGGIVEQVDVLNKSTLRDPAFIDCMRQSFLSVRFPPPEGGGMVTVEYPIEFSAEEQDD